MSVKCYITFRNKFSTQRKTVKNFRILILIRSEYMIRNLKLRLNKAYSTHNCDLRNLLPDRNGIRKKNLSHGEYTILICVLIKGVLG